MPVLTRRLVAAGLGSLVLALISAGALLAQTGGDPIQEGSAVFQRWCSTCHGDRGQGLTPEWRATWPPDHQNCSRRFCHGPDHPPWAAYIPNNSVPALIGPETLGRFDSPAQLYWYTYLQMPRGWEGHLSAEEYWVLTVYLLHYQGLDLANQPPWAGWSPSWGWSVWKAQRLEGMD